MSKPMLEIAMFRAFFAKPTMTTNMSYMRTPEHQARQAERIREWKHWEKSTGPRTLDGKAKAAMRGYIGGLSPKVREDVKRLTNALMAHVAMKNTKV